MAKILRLTDTIKLGVEEVTFHLRPLSKEQKEEISNCITMVEGEPSIDVAKSNSLYLKFALKDIEGVEGFDGEPYVLTKNEQGLLTDECIEEVLQLNHREKLVMAAYQMLETIPDEFIHSVTGEPLGVSVGVNEGLIREN
ncbi:MAG: hypothetical protein ACPGJV_02735 [Bacteriovoracaceae bacterium]